MNRSFEKVSHEQYDDSAVDSFPEQQNLQDYLEARYTSNTTKKKKKKPPSTKTSLRIVDTDISGFTPIQETIEVVEADADAPVIVNPSEALVPRLRKKNKVKKKSSEWIVLENPIERGRVDLNTTVEERNRQLRGFEDLSPPRQTSNIQDVMNEDLSPPRRPSSKKSEDGDLSPPRRSTHPQTIPQKRHMMDGTSAGVVTADMMKEELKRRRRLEKEKLAEMEDYATGKGAQTVYRNKEGRRVTLEELEREKANNKKVKWEKVEWDSGLVQQQNVKRIKEDFEREKAKPFARARDDEDLDAMYRARRRWGDPMGHLDKKSKLPDPLSMNEFRPVIDETNRHWFEKSGFVIPQEIPPHSWIRRGVAPLSNRFNIRPGRHWDGVDRSNGFERDYAKYLNECAAKDREAAAWCMEDM